MFTMTKTLASGGRPSGAVRAGTAGLANLADAKTQFEAIYQAMWGERLPMSVSAEALIYEATTSGKFFEIPQVTSSPRVRQWTGGKIYKDLRAFAQRIEVNAYEASTKQKRLDVETDPEGVGTALRQFLSRSRSATEDLVMTTLLGNPTGYDGVALLHDAHPFSNSTGDNLTTTALTHASYQSMRAQMMAFTDEDGTPLHVMPDALIVGPSQERIALEVTGADRPIYFNASAAEATSSVIGAVRINNVYQGSARVYVSPYITGSQWFLTDTREMANGLAPIVVVRKRAFEPQTLDNPTGSDSTFDRDEYKYSLTGDYGFGAGLWQVIGGRIAA